MITKGIITELVSKYQARVRIPIYDKAETSATATPNKFLSVATMCIQPGILPNYQVGDVVYVDFEMDIISQPIIMGLLFREGMNDSYPDIFANNIAASHSAVLPTDTNIGIVSPNNILALQDVNGSIQEQLNINKGKGPSTEYPPITNAEIDEITDN